MSALSLRLPESLHEQLKELAQEEGILVNQLVMPVVAEKIAAISTMAYLEKWAKRSNWEKLLSILNKAPDVAPRSAAGYNGNLVEFGIIGLFPFFFHPALIGSRSYPLRSLYRRVSGLIFRTLHKSCIVQYSLTDKPRSMRDGSGGLE